jgi:HptB-dependent secretion and biofilm anti anti-sigma factor
MKYRFSFDHSEVALSGQLTFPDHTNFRALADKLLKSAGQPLVIDLADLDFIDSAGLGMLLIVRNEAERANRTVALRAPRGQVKKIFELSKFESLFGIEK